MSNKHTQNTSFFYLAMVDSYMILDTECCSKSHRTFDIQFAFLANYKPLLNILNLFYLVDNGDNVKDEYRMKCFAGYLSSMSTQNKDEKYQKLLKNPTIRILAMGELLDKINALDIEKLSAQYTLTANKTQSE